MTIVFASVALNGHAKRFTGQGLAQFMLQTPVQTAQSMRDWLQRKFFPTTSFGSINEVAGTSIERIRAGGNLTAKPKGFEQRLERIEEMLVMVRTEVRNNQAAQAQAIALQEQALKEETVNRRTAIKQVGDALHDVVLGVDLGRALAALSLAFWGIICANYSEQLATLWFVGSLRPFIPGL